MCSNRNRFSNTFSKDYKAVENLVTYILKESNKIQNLSQFLRKNNCMKDDKEIAALVSLLDDPDINIYNLVKSQLINVGNDYTFSLS